MRIDIGHNIGCVLFRIAGARERLRVVELEHILIVGIAVTVSHHDRRAEAEMEFRGAVRSRARHPEERYEDRLEVIGLVRDQRDRTAAAKMFREPHRLVNLVIEALHLAFLDAQVLQPEVGIGVELAVNDHREVEAEFRGDAAHIFPVAEMEGDYYPALSGGGGFSDRLVVFVTRVLMVVFRGDAPEFQVFYPETDDISIELADDPVLLLFR